MTDERPPMPPMPPTPPTPPAPPPAPTYSFEPAVTAMDPVATPKRRGAGGRVGFIVGVVALIAVLGAGLATMLGSDGGAGSAEEAVRGLADAAAAEDILSAAQYLPPSEVGSAPDLYNLANKVLQKNKVLGPKGKPLAGVDIKVDDLELSTTMLSDRVGKVELVSGTLAAEVKASEVDPEIRRASEESGDDPIEDSSQSVTVAEWREQLLDATAGVDLGTDQQGEISGLYLVAIKEDGRWYVSYQYTLLEYARELAGAPMPTFAAPVEGKGVAKPETLLTTAIDELNALDENTIADAIERQTSGTKLAPNTGFVNPSETQAMADYLPVFEGILKELQGGLGVDQSDNVRDIAEQIRQLDISVHVEATSEVTSLADGRSMVVLRSAEVAISVSGVFQDEDVEVTMTMNIHDGTCASFQVDARSSGGNSITEGTDSESCADLFAGTDFRGFFFVAVKSGGSWYLSPIETVVQYVRFGLESELAK